LVYLLPAGQVLAQPLPITPRDHPLKRLPLGFEANAGQFDKRVRYRCRTEGFELSLTPDAAIITMKGTSATLRLAGAARHIEPAGVERLPGVTNYIIGNDPRRWKTGIPQFRRVRYAAAYPGIDVEYYGDGRSLEFDFSVHPFADPSAVRMSYDGVEALHRTPAGDLELSIAGRNVLQRRPVAWQETGGKRVPVPVEYIVNTQDRQVGLQIASYDHSQPLTIDPVLQYGTFFGGTGDEGANSLAIDPAGNAYITGYTTSPNLPSSPVTPYQPGLRGPSDAYVAKVNPAGTALVYTTYLGGSGDDQGTSIAVDTAGNAYLSGSTSSPDFPSAGGGVAAYYGGASDGFVTVLNASGRALIYSGYIGGPGDDVANAITLDTSANIYVTGFTTSATFTSPPIFAGVPPTIGAQTTNGGGYDAFIMKLSKTGSIIYSTYFGGTGDEYANGIAVDQLGIAYVVGSSTSSMLPGATSRHTGSGRDAFLVQVDSRGASFLAVRDLGGSSDQSAFGVAVDAGGGGNCYLTGLTNSTDFPVVQPSSGQNTVGLQPRNAGGYDAFITEISKPATYTPSTIVFSTYLGGQGTDVGYSIAIDSNKDIYVAGYTDSSDFLPSLSSRPSPGPNTFVAELANLSTYIFAAYLGAFDVNHPVTLALSIFNEVLIAGYAGRGFSFPNSSTKPIFGFAGGTSDAYLVKLGTANLSFSQTAIGSYNGSPTPGGSILPGSDALISFAVMNQGPAAASDVSVQVQLPPGAVFFRCLSAPTTCTVSGSTVTGLTVTISLGTLAAGAASNISILIGTSPTLDSLSVNLTILSGTNDPIPGDNFMTLSASVVGVSSFQLSTLDLKFGSVPHGQQAGQMLTITPTAAAITVNLTLTPVGAFALGLGSVQSFTLDHSTGVNLLFLPIASASYTATLDVMNANGGETKTVILEGIGTGPSITKVEDSAGSGSVVTDNGYVTLIGTNFTDPNRTWPDPNNPGRTWAVGDFVNGQMPTSLDGIFVRIDGQQAFVEYISPTQINVLAPPDPNKSVGPIAVSVDLITPTGTASATVTKDIVAPGLFSYSCNIPNFCNDPTRVGRYASATRGPSIVGYPGNPVQPGQAIALYLSGMGDTTPEYDNGRPLSQFVHLANQPTVTIGGLSATVTYAGMVVGAAGLYQFNVMVPPNLSPGDQPVVVTVLGRSTPSSGQMSPVILNVSQ